MKTTLALALQFLLCATAALADRPVSETRATGPRPSVHVDILVGTLVVSGWERHEVEVTGTIGDDVEAVEVEGDGDDVSIDVELPRLHRSSGDRTTVDLEIKVPTGARIDVDTLSARVRVRGVDGALEVGTMSGDIDVDGAAGSARLETVSGNISIAGTMPRVTVESVSGTISVDGVGGSVETSSMSGRIVVTGDRLERAQLESVAGTIELRGGLLPGADVEISSHSGEVKLFLPADSSATFEVETLSGNIENALGPPARKSQSFLPGLHLEFALGTGDASVSIETFSGNVRLLEQ